MPKLLEEQYKKANLTFNYVDLEIVVIWLTSL